MEGRKNLKFGEVGLQIFRIFFEIKPSKIFFELNVLLTAKLTLNRNLTQTLTQTLIVNFINGFEKMRERISEFSFTLNIIFSGEIITPEQIATLFISLVEEYCKRKNP